jgi:hypothetical protein
MAVFCFIAVLRLMTNGAFTDTAQMNFLRELELEIRSDDTKPDMGLAEKTMWDFAGSPTLKLSLAPSPLVLTKGGRRKVKVTCMLTNLTDRDLSWSTTSPAVATVTKAESTDTWTIEGLSEGLAQMTIVANADRNAAANLPVRVLPRP